MSTNFNSRLNWWTENLLCICLKRSNNNIVKVFNRTCAIIYACWAPPPPPPLLALWQLVRQNSLRNMLAISHRTTSTNIDSRLNWWTYIYYVYVSNGVYDMHAPRVLKSFEAPSSFHFFLQYSPPLQDISLDNKYFLHVYLCKCT